MEKNKISIEELVRRQKIKEELESKKDKLSIERLLTYEEKKIKIEPVKHDWPHLRGPNMNGFTDLSDGKGNDYMVVFASTDNHVYAYDLRGNRLWLRKIEEKFPPFSGTVHLYAPAVVDKTIYLTTHKGMLYALDFDGNIKFSKQIKGAEHTYAPTAPVVKKDNIAVGHFFNAFLLDLKGNVFWSTRKGSVEIPPVMLDDLILFVQGGTDHKLQALDYSGNEKWFFDKGSGIFAFYPVVDNGTIYFSTDLGGLYALDLEGKVKWNFRVKDATLSPPTIRDNIFIMNYEGGAIHHGSEEGGVVAISKGGKILWKKKLSGIIEKYHSKEAPVIYKNQVIVPSHCRIFGYDLYNGNKLWGIEVAGSSVSSPSVYDGIAVFNNGYGTTYAMNPDEIIPFSRFTKNPAYIMLARFAFKAKKMPKELWKLRQYKNGNTFPDHYQSLAIIVRK